MLGFFLASASFRELSSADNGMPDPIDKTTGARGRWELTREALDGLLQSLGGDRNAAGRRYEILRSKLIDLFGVAAL